MYIKTGRVLHTSGDYLSDEYGGYGEHRSRIRRRGQYPAEIWEASLIFRTVEMEGEGAEIK